MKTTKRCSVCKEEKPADLDHFQRDRHNLPSKLTASCKACRSVTRINRYRNVERETMKLVQELATVYGDPLVDPDPMLSMFMGFVRRAKQICGHEESSE